MTRETQVFDLGFPMARLEAQENGEPVVTIVSPANDENAGQTITIGSDGIEGFLALAHRLRYWNEKVNASEP